LAVETKISIGGSRITELWSRETSSTISVDVDEGVGCALVDRDTSVWADALSSTRAFSLAKRTTSGGVREVITNLVADGSNDSFEVKETVDIEDVMVDWRRSNLWKLSRRRDINSNCIHGPSLSLSACNILCKELGHTIVETVGENKHDSWNFDGTIWIWLISCCAVDTTVNASVSSGLHVAVENFLDGCFVKAERKSRIAQSTADRRILSREIIYTTEEDQSNLSLIWSNDEAIDDSIREGEECLPLISVDGTRLIEDQDEIYWRLALRNNRTICAWWDDKESWKGLSVNNT
jgi:hypothetical protein